MILEEDLLKAKAVKEVEEEWDRIRLMTMTDSREVWR
jgi:hypothetical protein